METVHNTILIVEDDLGLNELISGKIAEAGYQTHSAYSVSEALDWLSGNKPLLMVVDYSLSNQTAKYFIESIKTENLPLPPFIIATGQGNERVAVEMMKLGARDYIIKDTNLLELLPTIIGRVAKEIENDNKLKFAETLLENERALYLDLVNSQPAGIYRIRVNAKDKWDKNAWINANKPPFKFDLVSQRFCDILEISKSNFEANPGILIDLVHPDDKDEFVRRNDEANTLISTFIWDCRLLVNDKIKWIHFESLPRKLENGDILFTGIIYDVSEQKLAQENLIESELRFKVLFADAPDAMFLADPESHKIIDANNAACLLFKKNISELVGMFQYELHPPQNRDLAKSTFKEHIEESKQTEKSIPIENNIICSDGTVVPVEILGHSIMIGEKQLIMGTFRDITERKKIEDAVKFLITCGVSGSGEDFFKSLAKYLSQILDMEYVCIDTLDGDGLTAHTLAIYNDGVYDTNASYALHQTPCGQVVGKNICFFPENVSKLFPHDDALRDLNAESYVGSTLWSFDGIPIGLIAIIGRKPLKNKNLAETILRLVSVRAAGELERKKVEDALRDSEQVLLKSQQIAQLGSYSWDITKGYWTSSAILDNIFGIDKNYIRTTQAWLDLIHPDWQEIMSNYIKNNIELNHQRFDKEYKIIRKENGQECWVHGLGDIEFDNKNNAIKLTGTIININNRKVAEEALLKKIYEIEYMNKFMINREVRMSEMKKEINELLESMGKEKKY